MEVVVKTILFFFLLSVILIGCTGKDGKDGAIGPVGPSGKDGNANVKVIKFSVLPTDWQSTGTSFVYTKSGITSITQAIKDSGSVLVYLENPSQGIWIALPYTYTYSIGGTPYSKSYLYAYKVGEVKLEEIDSDLITLRPETTQNYKVVIIASSVLAKKLSRSQIQNYESIKEILNIQE